MKQISQRQLFILVFWLLGAMTSQHATAEQSGFPAGDVRTAVVSEGPTQPAGQTRAGGGTLGKLSLRFANLHNPYFPDRNPDQAVGKVGTFFHAAAIPRFMGIEGDIVQVPITLVTPADQKSSVSIRIFQGNKDITPLVEPGRIRLHRAIDVRVEGNSNGNCSCSAGKLPRTVDTGNVCIATNDMPDAMTPRGCPTTQQRVKIADTWIRDAPFLVKEALEPLSSGDLVSKANQTELLIFSVPISATLPKGDVELRVVARAGSDESTIKAPLRVLKLKLEGFPDLDVSYWVSEDPRDLVVRPKGVPINGSWGGAWWGDEHWRNIETLATVLRSTGVTSTLVPLFVRNPFGIDASALIGVKCLTGSSDVPTDFNVDAGVRGRSRFNNQVADWDYEFDFTNFRRWVGIFKAAGFRQFEGAHLAAHGGVLPVQLECDLFANRDAKVPYRKSMRFLPRAGAANEEAEQREFRSKLYREKFLPKFLSQLGPELKALGIGQTFVQHLIDENAPTDEAVRRYSALVDTVRSGLPGVKIMDAINQYNAAKYAGLVDIPVFHVALLYDDQMRHKNIRTELTGFKGRKFFYNTALREGGPNRFLDTNPLDSRAYGWMGLELGFNGFLYWAANAYRYPASKDAGSLNREADWSPFNNSLGPLPGGAVSPGEAAGSNWFLYPTDGGLVDSIRARRFRDGLLDHWIYLRAWVKCRDSGGKDCKDSLLNIRKMLSADSTTIADFSRNPMDYDDARRKMIDLLEP